MTMPPLFARPAGASDGTRSKGRGLLPPAAAPQVKVHQAGFPPDHSPYPRFRRNPAELFKARLGGAMVRHGNLSGSDYSRDKGDILANTPG